MAAAVGAKAMRCYLGSSADRMGEPGIEAHMENTIKVFRSVRSEALDLRVKIAIENHDGDMQAREVKAVIEESGKDFVEASNLDTGNPLWVVEDPLLTLEVLAPYVITSHIRDVGAVRASARGAAGRMGRAGRWPKSTSSASSSYSANGARKRRCNSRSSPAARRRVIPYLEQDFWKPFPKALASENSRASSRWPRPGHPYMGAMVIEDVAGQRRPAIMTDALKEQQRIDLEQSLEYAKKKLNVGVNWRG